MIQQLTMPVVAAAAELPAALSQALAQDAAGKAQRLQSVLPGPPHPTSEHIPILLSPRES